ncbi:unnamed protein product, partial [Ectocarpus sp. 12 AP-2014]
MRVVCYAAEQGTTHVPEPSSSRHDCGSFERCVPVLSLAHSNQVWYPTEQVFSCRFDFSFRRGVRMHPKEPLEFNASGDQINGTCSKTTSSQSSKRRRHTPPSLPFELKC